MNDYIIRLEKDGEQRATEGLVRDAFWNVYRPGAYEHAVLHVMRDSVDFIDELNLVMEREGELIGQAVFVKSCIKLDGGGELPTLTLGPICIKKELQGRGYGRALLDYAFERAADIGYGAVLFEGNIDFYGKSGCVTASDYGIRYHGLDDGDDTSFFLCRELKSGYLANAAGEYSAPSIYFVSKEHLEAIDKAFPEKEKKKLPGQLFD